MFVPNRNGNNWHEKNGNWWALPKNVIESTQDIQCDSTVSIGARILFNFHRNVLANKTYALLPSTCRHTSFHQWMNVNVETLLVECAVSICAINSVPSETLFLNRNVCEKIVQRERINKRHTFRLQFAVNCVAHRKIVPSSSTPHAPLSIDISYIGNTPELRLIFDTCLILFKSNLSGASTGDWTKC